MTKLNDNLFIGNTNIKLNDLNGAILWTNPNPTNSMAANIEINLSSSDYDVLEILFATYTDNKIIQSTKTLKGKDIRLSSVIYSSNLYGMYRNIPRVSDTKYKTSECYYGSSTPQSNNSYCIPLYIIGYKTGLFS